jgi:hypothetical protein
MQIFYTTIQAADFSSEAIQAVAILKRWVMFLLLTLLNAHLILKRRVQIVERAHACNFLLKLTLIVFLFQFK